MLNYRAVPGGQSDPECTHVILEQEEYGRLVAEKQRAVADAAEAKRSARLQIDREWRNAQAEIEQAKQEAQEIVEMCIRDRGCGAKRSFATCESKLRNLRNLRNGIDRHASKGIRPEK